MRLGTTKKLALIALLLSYYLVSTIVPIPTVACFSRVSMVLGLAFHFISKRQRIIVTTLYQIKSLWTLQNLIVTLHPTIIATLDYSLKDTATTVTSSGAITPTVLFWLVNPLLFKSIVFFMIGISIASAIIGVTIYIVNLVLMLTQPYSTYILYKQVKIFEKIENTIGGRINFE